MDTDFRLNDLTHEYVIGIFKDKLYLYIVIMANVHIKFQCFLSFRNRRYVAFVLVIRRFYNVIVKY